jgi:hypothetical protein
VARAGDLPTHQIHRQIGREEHRQLALRLECMAQGRANARGQFSDAKRLADMVVRAEIKPA